MPKLTIKAPFLRLPPELMNLIIHEAIELVTDMAIDAMDGKYDDAFFPSQWLPIARTDEAYLTRRITPDTAALLLLRALSQTSQYLRDCTLPYLWDTICVKTIDELGRLHEYIMAEPSIAAHIRSFSFDWRMNIDFERCDPYGDEFGTLLDMAFIDRGSLWAKTLEAHSAQAVSDLQDDDLYFEVDGVRYVEPGIHPRSAAAARLSGKTFPHPRYPHRGRNVAAIGPDGTGMDKRITNANDFNGCINDLAAVFPATLRNFHWHCYVAQIPAAACSSLKNVSKFSRLDVELSMRRRLVNMAPIWELASSVEHVFLDFRDEAIFAALALAKPIDEVTSEDDFPSLRMLRSSGSALVKDRQLRASHEVRYVAACRTIVAAARNGKLKTLRFQGDHVEEPFAMRSLVVVWVHVIVEGYLLHYPGEVRYDDITEAGKWASAAVWLRRTLFHASIWLPRPLALPGEGRLLTPTNVQSILVHLMESSFDDGTGKIMAEPYLRWFQEDVELAKQVSEAWNRVVECGGANHVLCKCRKCKSVIVRY